MSTHDTSTPALQNLHTLADRLAYCAEKVGGKRALTQSAEVSEAQFFRYLNGESDMPVSRLQAVADAAGVNAGWLLTGDGASAATTQAKRPEFRPELLQKLSQALDEVLVEYPQRLSLRLKARYLPIIYESVRHEEVRSGVPWQGTRAHMVIWLDYLTAIKDDEGLALYEELVKQTVAGKGFEFDAFMADELVQLTTRAITHRYNGPSGDVDFRQLTQSVVQESARRRLAGMVEDIRKAFPAQSSHAFLDIGCGNGRDLAFIHGLIPTMKLKGTDCSDQAVRLCQKLEQAHKLPANTVTQTDLTNLPFENQVFDGAQMRLSLPFIPYIEGHNSGAPQALAEARRILKTNGLLFGDVFVGEGHVLVPYVQLYTKESFGKMAYQAGFDVIDWQETVLVSQPENALTQYNNYESHVRVVARFKMRNRA